MCLCVFRYTITPEYGLQSEYEAIADELSNFVVELLDWVKTSEELDVILNQNEGTDLEDSDQLARLKLAVCYKEMKVKKQLARLKLGVCYKEMKVKNN